MKLLIFKSNMTRFIKEPAYLLITAIVLIAMTAATAFAVTMKTPTAEIGVTASAAKLLKVTPIKSQKIEFTQATHNQNAYQKLILGKYDAYVTKRNGSYQVTTIRSSALEKQLSTYLNTGVYTKQPGVKTHTFKIFLSILVMSTMMLSLILYKFYFDDCDGMDQRIYLSGISNRAYLFQHFAFNVFVLICISLVATISILPLFGIKLSVGLLAAVVLINIFSSAFGLMIATLTRTKQGAMGIGTILTVLTLMLSGGLFTVKKGTLQETLQYFFPQHYIADLGKSLDGSSKDSLALGVIALYTIIFMSMAWLLQKKRRLA